MEIQAGSAESSVCVCDLTQEMGAVWADRDLFQAYPLGTCWVPNPGGRELKGKKRLGLGVFL